MAFGGVLGEGDNYKVTIYEPAQETEATDGRRFYRRLDMPDLIYKLEHRLVAVIDEIQQTEEAGRPVLGHHGDRDLRAAVEAVDAPQGATQRAQRQVPRARRSLPRRPAWRGDRLRRTWPGAVSTSYGGKS